jgi:hypothetical protein
MPEEPHSSNSRPEPIDVEPVPFRSGRRSGGDRIRRAAAALGGLAAGALVLALVAGGWFVLTARQVSIRVEPEPDAISLAGGWFTPRIGERYLLRPGTYTLHASLACHRELVQRFEVDANAPPDIRLAFQKLPVCASRPFEAAPQWKRFRALKS